VLARQDGTDGGPDLVLDGQQRLTTLSLTISVLVHKLRAEGAADADEQKMYLFSRRLKGKKAPKVLLQPEDAKLFETLISEPERAAEPRIRSSRLGAAVLKIVALLDEYAAAPQFKDTNKPFEAMLGRILYDVELVRITAPSERDAFRLFETLNDRGLALSAADLIKNKIFSRCKDELDDAVEAWSSIVQLTRNDDVVNFLRSYWIAFYGLTRKSGLYDTYKGHIDRLGSTEATLFVMELDDYARAYDQIVAPTARCEWGVDIASGLERLANSFRAKSCRPVLLAFAVSRSTDLGRAIRLCESITVRYSVVGEKNPSYLERMYAEMCLLFRQGGDVWSRFRDTVLFDEVPDDEHFRTKLQTMEISTLTPGWREVLVGLNGALSDGEMRVERASRVHVEHILPQTPRAAALAEAGLSPEEAARFVNRLGNLTLLSNKKNQQASNKPFSEKRKAYSRSDVHLTRELAQLTKWDAEAIEARSLRLANAAVSVFPHPKQIVA
jgi:hypothetical protein